MNKRQAGQIGGLTTLIKHGRGFYSRIGAMGGRPRQPSVSELLSGEIKEERLPNDLKGLKSLFAKKLEGVAAATPERGA